MAQAWVETLFLPAVCPEQTGQLPEAQKGISKAHVGLSSSPDSQGAGYTRSMRGTFEIQENTMGGEGQGTPFQLPHTFGQPRVEPLTPSPLGSVACCLPKS